MLRTRLATALSIALFHALIVLTPVYGGDGDCPGCGVVKDFDDVRQALSSALSAPIGCTDFSGNNSTCSFAALCRKMAGNSESAFLYENSEGEKIPNFSLIFAEQGVAACYSQNQPRKNLTDQMRESQSKMRESQLKALKAVEAFSDSVRKHHEQLDWFEISNASTKIALDNIAKGKTPTGMMMWVPPTRDQIEKQLTDLEKASGRKLSDESRRAYVEMTDLQMNGFFAAPGMSQDASKEWKEINQNPFLDPSLFVDANKAGGKEQVLKNQALFQQEVNRIYGVFKSTQQQILNYLDEKQTEANGAAIDDLKKRIQTVRLNIADPASPLEGCQGPNAFYSPTDHSFHICPQVMQMPAETLKMIIAHELSHSIDPCTLSNDLLAVQGSKIDMLVFGAGPNSDDEKRAMEKRLQEQSEKAGFFPFKPKDPQPKSDTDYLVDFLGLTKPTLSKVYENPKTSVQAAAIPFTDHPFASMLRCLRSSDAIGARVSSLSDFTKSLDQMIQKQRATGASERSSPELAKAIYARAHARKFMDLYGACSFVPGAEGHSQLQEVFADKVASEIVARDLATKSPAEKQAGVFEAAGFFLSVGCPNLGAEVSRKADALLRKYKCGEYQNQNVSVMEQAFQANARAQDEHPWEIDRINRLLLAHPDLRSDLGCSSKPEARYCR